MPSPRQFDGNMLFIGPKRIIPICSGQNNNIVTIIPIIHFPPFFLDINTFTNLFLISLKIIHHTKKNNK
ncbi:hypothetical protein KPSB59_2510009 [Klebsiella quasipneumoniae subsp. quasipneumoniae]|nr:hypothetical protein KPSB59_2510009 [Klebsiella quasipneumoniae subsp. quasipneumoniae]